MLISFLQTWQNFSAEVIDGLENVKVWFINTASGAIIDEKALFSSLSSESLAGVNLDVFESEP